MESLFFNTPNQRYQISGEKVDISNGIFFYDIALSQKTKTIKFKNLEQMLMMVVVKSGTVSVENHVEDKKHKLKADSITLYGSSLQEFSVRGKG